MLSQAAAEFPGTECVKLFALPFIYLLLLSSSYSQSSISHKPASFSSSSASSSSSSSPSSITSFSTLSSTYYWLPSDSFSTSSCLTSSSYPRLFSSSSPLLQMPASSPRPLLHEALISPVCLLFPSVDHMQNSCEEEPYIEQYCEPRGKRGGFLVGVEEVEAGGLLPAYPITAAQ